MVLEDMKFFGRKPVVLDGVKFFGRKRKPLLRRKIKVILVIAYVQHLIWDGMFLYWPLIISLPFLTDKIQNLNGSQKNGLSIPTIYAQGHKTQMSTP